MSAHNSLSPSPTGDGEDFGTLLEPPMPDHGPFHEFCEELDTLLSRWTDKPADDRLEYAQIVGALTFKAFVMMQNAQTVAKEGNTE